MCGIAGFASLRDSTEDRTASVARMNAAMYHRGPDDHGIVSHDPATLGMRRLAIFDPANGHQPMQSADGRFTLVFNGAIYNFHALRTELIALGASFATQCDTEVLLAAFAHWGQACLSRLRGMFAFAVWDRDTRELFLARDPLGIKPLYFSEQPERILFASELRALLASGKCSAELDPAALRSNLAYLSVPAPNTLYLRIKSLRPGECALWKAGHFSSRRYWNFKHAFNTSSPVCHTRAEFIAELRLRLEDSIRAHALADVPVGTFLSGGLDSGAITALLARHSRQKLKTFSIAFPEAAYSEAHEAEQTARHLGTEHTTFFLEGARVATDLETILASYDQPSGDALNTYYASLAARSGGVTAALSGLGGDELFGGYPWFRDTPKIARWLGCWRTLPSPLRRLIATQLSRGNTRHQKLGDFLLHARDLHEVASLQRRSFSEASLRSILSADLPFNWHGETDTLREELSDTDPLTAISGWELRTYMADVLLRDSDVMSMQHSLELRVPFVDRPLLEWLWSQPAHFRYDLGHPKSALAEAVADLLPTDIQRRKKRGFTLPFPLWMRGPLKPFLDETFSHASLSRSNFFNSPAVQARWQTFCQNPDHHDWSRVWSLAILINFVNRPTPSPHA